MDQTGFIAISKNFIYALELVQHCHKQRLPTLVLKLDFAKAFDSVNWDSLLKILQCRGFPATWCSWIQHILTTSKSAILLNGCPGSWFTCKKGSGKGTPYPHICSCWWQTSYNASSNMMVVCGTRRLMRYHAM